jgi:hypothetical protein
MTGVLVTFCGEDRFRIGARDFTYGNPAEPTNERTQEKYDRG